MILLVPEGGLALYPVHHMVSHSNGHLQLEVRSFVITPQPQDFLIYMHRLRLIHAVRGSLKGGYYLKMEFGASEAFLEVRIHIRSLQSFEQAKEETEQLHCITAS